MHSSGPAAAGAAAHVVTDPGALRGAPAAPPSLNAAVHRAPCVLVGRWNAFTRAQRLLPDPAVRDWGEAGTTALWMTVACSS